MSDEETRRSRRLGKLNPEFSASALNKVKSKHKVSPADKAQVHDKSANGNNSFNSPNRTICEPGKDPLHLSQEELEFNSDLSIREVDSSAGPSSAETSFIQTKPVGTSTPLRTANFSDKTLVDSSESFSEDESDKTALELIEQLFEQSTRTPPKVETMPNPPGASGSTSTKAVVPSSFHQFSPGKFNGDGSVDALDFIREYEKVADGLAFVEDQKIHVFSMLLKGTADCWYQDLKKKHALPDAEPLTWKIISEQFLIMFGIGGKGQDDIFEYQLSNRKMRPTEPIVAYVYDILHLIGRLSYAVSEQRKMDAVMNGLILSYRERLILQQPSTVEDMLNKLKL